MWGIAIGSLLFVFGLTWIHSFSLPGCLIATAGMTLALAATARYAVDLLSPANSAKRTIYDDMGLDPTSLEQQVATIETGS